MLKNFIVIDNIFKKPELIRGELLKEKYFKNEDFNLQGLKYYDKSFQKPSGSWRGFRTQDLLFKYPDKGAELLNGVLSKVIGKRVQARGELYGHISTSLMSENIRKKNSWHVDEGDLFAGVVFLAENPIQDSGTWLKINGTIKKIENKFNRLVMYRADIVHTPGNFFGYSANDSRLTLTFFIKNIYIF